MLRGGPAEIGIASGCQCLFSEPLLVRRGRGGYGRWPVPLLGTVKVRGLVEAMGGVGDILTPPPYVLKDASMVVLPGVYGSKLVMCCLTCGFAESATRLGSTR